MYTYETVSEAVAGLKERGFTASFEIQHDCIFCDEKRIRLSPWQFFIEEVHRFEGTSDPADETIVYAISSTDGKWKGTLVNAYGTYADSYSDEIVRKLEIKRRDVK